MRVRVRLPGVLRPTAEGQAHLEVEITPGGTVGALLDLLAARYPLLERRIRDEQGVLRRYVNCYVDGEECRRLAGQDTPLADGTEVELLPSVAGG